jgi:hypothetical protein
LEAKALLVTSRKSRSKSGASSIVVVTRLPGIFPFIKPHPFDDDMYLATHLPQFQELLDNKQRAVMVLEMIFELLGDALRRIVV